MNNFYCYNVDLVALHITEVCGHKCPMCYFVNENNKKAMHYPLDDLLKVVNELANEGVKEISLLGGDPATHPNILEIVAFTSNKGLIISSLSNTHNYKNSDLNAISKHVDNFETTFHHFKATEHDNFCNTKGAFRKVTENLKFVKSLGKKVGIALNITPDTHSIIYNIVTTLLFEVKLEIDYIIIQRIIPFGRAASSSQFTLSRDQVVIAINQLKRIKEEFKINFVIEDPVPLCVLPDNLKEFVIPCQWGISKVAIKGNGDVSRCGADPRYRLGNIFEKKLLEIWNNSPMLDSFRNKQYLPGRCQVCGDKERCGGGCPLSCEMEKDHGIDYLYLEHEKIDKKIHGKLSFRTSNPDELSSMLQIEWGNFSGYGHIFSVKSLRDWYSHNPNMFKVVVDEHHWILAYAVLVPISEKLFNKICIGKYSAIIDFPTTEVKKRMKSEYYHIEVIATIPSKHSSRSGSYMIKKVGQFLFDNAKFVTASPVSGIGVRLCDYFNFKHIADEIWDDKTYPIYRLDITGDGILNQLNYF